FFTEDAFNCPDATPSSNSAKRDLPFSEGLIRSLNLLPCSYLLYYFKQKEMLAIEMGEYYKGGARAQVVQKVEKQLFIKLHRDASVINHPLAEFKNDIQFL
ncbi:hypothetical protein ACUOA8_51845, partial [Escherichia sp. SS-MK2]